MIVSLRRDFYATQTFLHVVLRVKGITEETGTFQMEKGYLLIVCFLCMKEEVQ